MERGEEKAQSEQTTLYPVQKGKDFASEVVKQG